MTYSAVIFRVSRMEYLYNKLIADGRLDDFLGLQNYYYSDWADDRDFIFSETNLSYTIFQPNKLSQLFEISA